MNKVRCFLPVALAVISVCASRATTVIAPTFDELVSQADLIFQGKVTAMTSQWAGEGAQRIIVSYVTFGVEDSLKGTPGPSFTIRMLGGTVDGQTMEVADAPKFAVGDRGIVFVQHNGSQFIPLVGIMHGLFRVERDQAGGEFIRTNEGKPLADLARLGRGDQPAITGNGMSAWQFKSAIRAKLAALGNGGH